MTKNELLASIIADLGANFKTGDETVLTSILDEVIDDALLVSNRYSKANQSEENMQMQIRILQSDIRKCTKAVYLRRGAEEISSENNGALSLNMTFENAIEVMAKDIIRTGKRLLR